MAKDVVDVFGPAAIGLAMRNRANPVPALCRQQIPHVARELEMIDRATSNDPQDGPLVLVQFPDVYASDAYFFSDGHDDHSVSSSTEQIEAWVLPLPRRREGSVGETSSLRAIICPT